MSAYVHIDVDDYLSDASDDALRHEIGRRNWPRDIEEWSGRGLADDLRSVFYQRDASRFEALLRVLEEHSSVEAANG